MSTEIERKFLVRSQAFRAMASSRSHIIQGYLSDDPARTVRIRIRDDRAYLTIKGPSAADGQERYEWEQQIPLADGLAIKSLCLPGLIDKHRYLVPFDGHVWEVDEFHDQNDGLILAEVELSQVGEPVSLPPFVGQEVTGDRRYYNSFLSQHPFATWAEDGAPGSSLSD